MAGVFERLFSIFDNNLEDLRKYCTGGITINVQILVRYF